MDSIDITDSAFSLNIPDGNEINEISLIGYSFNEYTIYIYAGIISLVILGCFYLFYFQNKKKEQHKVLDYTTEFSQIHKI